MHFSHSPQGPASKASLGGPVKIALVAALHLAVASVLVHQMSTRTFTMPRPFDDLTVDFRERTEAPPPPEPIAPEVRQQQAPQLVVPVLDIPIQPADAPAPSAVLPQDAAPAAPLASAAGAPTGSAEARPVPVQAPVMRSAVLADAKNCATPDYPARAARNGETGTVTLALLVGAHGRVLDSRILTSSGSRELDRAAQSALSLCVFQPAMENGPAAAAGPREGWARIAYVWTLD